MKAIFVHSRSILRDSHALDLPEADEPRLVPATLEAMRQLANEDVLVILFGHFLGQKEPMSDALQAIIEQISDAAGRVDVAVSCPHSESTRCECWGEVPGIVWGAVTQYGIDPASSFLIADCVEDVLTAKAAGVRPILVLGERSIADVVDETNVEKDFGIAADLLRAASFVAVEQEIAAGVGSARQVVSEVPLDYSTSVSSDKLPRIVAVSDMARESELRRSGARLRLGDITRWLILLTAGGLGLSLGIAYLLTHLYRVQAFPAFVGTLTLQFIPRPIRGALFIGVGLVFVALAIRSVVRATRVVASSSTSSRRERHNKGG